MSDINKTTPKIRAGGQTVVNPGPVSVIGHKYHFVFTENEMGELVIWTVTGRLLIQPLGMNHAVLLEEPYPKRLTPEKLGDGG